MIATTYKVSEVLKLNWYMILILGVALTLTISCSVKQNTPDPEIVKQAAYNKLLRRNGGNQARSTFELINFRVLETENVGNSVDVNVIGRFQGEIKLTEPLYDVLYTMEDGTKVLKPLDKPGKKTPLSGKYNAEIESMQTNLTNWDISVTFDPINLNGWNGRPKAVWPDALLQGSKELIRKETAIKLAKKKRIDEKNAWVDSVVGKWRFTQNYARNNRRKLCSPNSEGIDELYLKFNIPSNIQVNKYTAIDTIMYSPQHPKSDKKVPAKIKLVYGQRENQSIGDRSFIIRFENSHSYRCPTKPDISMGSLRKLYSSGRYGKFDFPRFPVRSLDYASDDLGYMEKID